MKPANATAGEPSAAVIHRAGELHDGVQRCLDCGFEFPLDPDHTAFASGDWIYLGGPSGYEVRRPSPSLRIEAERCTS